MTKAARATAVLVMAVWFLGVVVVGAETSTLEFVSPVAGEVVRPGQGITIEVRVHGFPDREIRAISDGTGLTMRPVDRPGTAVTVGFTGISGDRFTWDDRRNGVARITHEWQVPEDVEPGAYELEVRVWISRIRPYPLTVSQDIHVGDRPILNGLTKVEMLTPVSGDEVGVGDQVGMTLRVDGFPDREPSDEDELRLYLRVELDEEGVHRLLEEEPADYDIALDYTEEGVVEVTYEFCHRLTDPEVGLEDKGGGVVELTLPLLIPPQLGGGANQLPEGGIPAVLEAELNLTGVARIEPVKVGIVILPRPSLPVCVTREIRAFLNEECEVITLPGLDPSAWVRLHVKVKQDVPMVVLQERATGGCTLELSQETRDNTDFTIHSLEEYDIGGGKGLCWVLYPTGGVFEAGTTVEFVYSLTVPRVHSPGEVSVAGHWRTICSDTGIRHAPTENTELRVVSQLPMLVALARLDLETLQLKPDGFCAHVEDLDDLLRANYSFCDGDAGKARFEFFQDYIGRMIPGAGVLTVDHLLRMAAHRANGEPVVPCFGPIETEEE